MKKNTKLLTGAFDGHILPPEIAHIGSTDFEPEKNKIGYKDLQAILYL